VLLTNEWAPLDQPEDGHQLKFSAPGVGVVRIEPLGGVEQETVVLTKDNTLTDAERAEARAKVVTLDTRAYTLAKDIWQGTPPARPAPDHRHHLISSPPAAGRRPLDRALSFVTTSEAVTDVPAERAVS
jgi:hypothetical protein